MYKLGLTGGIATGKSTVSSFLREQGISVIDADQVAHDILNSDTVVLDQLQEAFGPDIFVNGQLSRPALGKIVFDNPDALAKLNAITHPRIYQCIDELGAAFEREGADIAVYDIPLLLETPNKMTFDGIMVISINPDQQLERLMARNNFSEEEAKKRIASQMPISEKAKLADFVIDNSGSTTETFNQVSDVINNIKE